MPTLSAVKNPLTMYSWPQRFIVHLYLWFYICKLNQLQIMQNCSIYYLKNPHISGPWKFKYLLSKGKLYFFLVHCPLQSTTAPKSSRTDFFYYHSWNRSFLWYLQHSAPNYTFKVLNCFSEGHLYYSNEQKEKTNKTNGQINLVRGIVI